MSIKSSLGIITHWLTSITSRGSCDAKTYKNTPWEMLLFLMQTYGPISSLFILLRKYTKCHEKYHSFWCWHMGPFLFILKPGAAMDKTCRRTINNMFHFQSPYQQPFFLLVSINNMFHFQSVQYQQLFFYWSLSTTCFTFSQFRINNTFLLVSINNM